MLMCFDYECVEPDGRMLDCNGPNGLRPRKCEYVTSVITSAISPITCQWGECCLWTLLGPKEVHREDDQHGERLRPHLEQGLSYLSAVLIVL